MEIGTTRNASPIVARRQPDRTVIGAFGCPIRKQLKQALLVSARLTKRYKGTAYESISLDLFERMEYELAKAEQREAVNRRAAAILNGRPAEKLDA